MTIDIPKISHVPALKSLMRSAFGESEQFLDKFFLLAYSPERARVALINGEVAAALYWFDCEYLGIRTAYLYAIATEEKHRGCGIGSALVLDTLKHLASLGYGSALLVPASPSLFGFYKKLGFKKATEIKEISARASGIKTEILEICADDYAKRRRELLCEGGVIEEGAILSLVDGDLKFYTGRDFLLLARREGKHLLGVELLGNTERAPDVLSALGCETGNFRTVDGGRDFAMYIPLASSSKPPTYFGIALDI